mgnify:CR=1 FL=1
MKSFYLATSLALAATGACAQSVMGTYSAYIGPQDMVSSSGKQLGSLCAMVQQDRANFHRFNRRDGSDGSDPVFYDKTLRGRIVNTCELTESGRNVYERARRGNPVFVTVRVLNDGGEMRVVVSEQAG